jgi:glycosyltransferase involved in cell wall biosynthesis
MDFALNVPINDVSFGQVSVALLKEMHARDLQPCIFPISKVSINTQSNLSEDFKSWLDSCISKATRSHSRSNPIFKLWHLQGSLESHSKEQVLLTFYELDQPTKNEINIAKNNRTCFTSEYSCDIYKDVGVETGYIPLGFDNDNFYKTDKQYYDDDRIVFNLVGKFEKRKNHQKVIETWLKKYGNNPKYFLNCAVYNPFFSESQNKSIWNALLKGKDYFNINFFQYFEKNDQYNDFLNSGHILIAASGGEGWGLPEFQSVAMGKHSLVLKATGYKGWANDGNSVLMYPTSKEEAYDNQFFKKGTDYNQGHVFWFDEEDFIEGCEESIERYKKNPINEEGLKLQEQFTYSKTVDKIIEELEKV